MSSTAVVQTSRVALPAHSPQGRSQLFLLVTGFAVGISSFVLIEPAPVDAIMMGLFILGFLSGILELSPLSITPTVLLSLFVVANWVSLYNPLDLTRAIWYIAVTTYMVASSFFFISFLSAYGSRGMQMIIKAYVLAALLCTIIGVLSYFRVIGFQQYLLLSGRPKGLFKDPNVFGPYLIAPALFALAGVISQRGRLRGVIIHGFSLLVATGGIILSYSRACWINYALCLVLYIAMSYTLRRVGSQVLFPVGRLILGCGIGLLTLCIFLQVPQVQSMMKERVSSNGLHDYDQDRFRTQRMALESVQSRPLGIGPGQAEQTFQYATHSSYMRVLSENGVLGFIGYLGFVIASLTRALIMATRIEDTFWKKIYLVTAACIAGHIINSAVVDTVHWRHYWLLLAIPWFNAAKWIAIEQNFRPVRFGDGLSRLRTSEIRAYAGGNF